MVKKLFIILLLSIISVSAQVTTTVIYRYSEWFPKDLNIQPFTANFLEPRAGFSFFLGKKNLRLDIGTSEDLYQMIDSNKVFSFGADVFTYTRLRSTKEFKFPVETVDYLFGLNVGYKIFDDNSEYGARLRVSHISAHLVDGQFDLNSYQWRDGTPFVFSREYIELMPYYKYNELRMYAGLTYLFHTTPPGIGKGIFQLGFDYFYENVNLPFTPFAAYDFKLSKVNKYKGNNTIFAGIKFDNLSSKGLSIYYSYISGYSVHGELFYKTENYSSIGINLDF
ncbi:MAG TPA: DUF1207 domain-containing protein [Ignavibacteriaceae bacterium]|nr:DUF1207 domain-containing protein [Ignavibacteriaceae bacterium]